MNPDPFSDTFHWLLMPGWLTLVFWILLLASIAIAAYALRTLPEQRTVGHVWNGLARLVIGAMWWEQTLWKLPPNYGSDPSLPFTEAGLGSWMVRMGQHASFQLQADFVNNVVLPHFYLFAPMVYLLELLTAIALMLGLFTRLWGAIGALQILNLWLGLYSAPGEWPWTYFFLLMLHIDFAVHRYGRRSLGLDAILAARVSPAATKGTMLGTFLEAAT